MKKRKKLKRKILSGFLTLCLTLFIIGIVYFGYKILFKEKEKEFLEKIETTAYIDIDKYAMYGIHMNLEGNFSLPETSNEITLLLTDGKTEIPIEWELEEQGNNTYHFKTSEYINEGLVLEDLPIGQYYLVIKTKNLDEEQQEIIKYKSEAKRS